ncbi:MAG TPA: ATP-binding protein [Gemmataceae bacterium]|nr:ATP-binding protein [Gemmataceae bacterium]
MAYNPLADCFSLNQPRSGVPHDSGEDAGTAGIEDPARLASLASDPPAQMAAEPEASAEQPAPRLKILIADDELPLRLLLERLLTKWGHEVVGVDNGLAAWQCLQGAEAPRLAILDWEMPGLIGPEVCRKVRAQAITPPPYLLLLTGREGMENIVTGLQAGANDYLPKPFNPAELRVRLDVGISMLELQKLELASRELERRVQERTAELARAHADNERLLTSISSILIGIDPGGRISKWNRMAERAFAVPAAQVLGQHWDEVGIPGGDRGLTELVLDCGRMMSEKRIENVPYTRPNGERGYLNLTITPIPREGKSTPSDVLVLGEDRTEQRALEAQLVQAQKLESIGHLAAGIAHEINTPIQYVGDNVRFVFDAFQDLQEVLQSHARLLATARQGPIPTEVLETMEALWQRADVDYLVAEIPQAVEQSLEGVASVARIVRAMKEFSHPGSEEKTAIDLNRAIENTLTVARNEYKYVANLAIDLDVNLPHVPCLPGELNQVILNLVVNAAHAIGERLENEKEGKGLITVSTHHRGPEVEVRITDTGCGIPEAIRPKIFDPFFTTKPVGIGTGQGLAIAHAVIVQKHGGTISFETEVGKGTTFILRLPLGSARTQRSVVRSS